MKQVYFDTLSEDAYFKVREHGQRKLVEYWKRTVDTAINTETGEPRNFDPNAWVIVVAEKVK